MPERHHIGLPIGYRLENYRLDGLLGHGGFGITYRALDEDLRDTVAIKEYLPREVAFRDQDTTVKPLSESDRETFEWGLERFLDEARTLARFRHPNIVGVRRFLRANGTAYLVMDYCEGESLERVLARDGTLSPERLEAMLVPLLDALEVLHAACVTHRDIKPGNIYLRDDGSPVLLDFGAARQALAQHSRSVTAMATPGYAAFEQYSTKGKQGPWTDIYGLGATLYRCVTGNRPPDASDRMLEDELVPTVEVASRRYPKPLLQQIDAALELRPQDRPQSIAAWRRFGVGSVASQPREREAVLPPVVEPQAPVPRPAREPPAVATGSGRGWVWLLIVPVGAVMGFFIWAGSEQPNPQPTATATRDPSVPRSAPSRSQGAGSSVPGGLIEARYQVLTARGEIVRDTVTGLEWQRCSLGQTWNGRACVGEAGLYTWDGAREAADRVNDWRLPTVDEMKTLTYCSSGQPARFSNGQMCQGDYRRPTIVQEAFPNAPSAHVWARGGIPWSVGFDDGWGEEHGNRTDLSLPVRLVRGEWMSHEEPTADQIIAWSSSDIRELGPKVKEVVPIALRSGEHAYLVAVDFDMLRTGRLNWRGYLIVRPSLNEARVLNGFGGQYNEIQPVDKRSRRQSSVIIGSAASGQGMVMSSYSVVTFDDWKAESLYTVEESSNSGWCGEDTGRDCSRNDVSIEIKNVSVFGHNQRIELVVHNERYSSPDPETTPYTYSIESEIVVIER